MVAMHDRIRKALVGALIAASLLASAAAGFGADHASARQCSFSDSNLEFACYGSDILPERRP